MRKIRPVASAVTSAMLLAALGVPPLPTAALGVPPLPDGGSTFATGLAVIGAPPVPENGAARAPNACDDDNYTTIGGPWTKTYKWWFRTSSTPPYLSRGGTLTVLKRSFSNMTDARNDCGLPDNVGATASYQGATEYKPNITRRGYCTSRDGRNVIGFGSLPPGVLAVTCIWFGAGNHIRESDMRISTNMDWELSRADCFYEQLLEPTATHEIGHIFGLGHVGERRHGRLTMSTISDGPCSNAESTLGWGDVRGMNHLYPQP